MTVQMKLLATGIGPKPPSSVEPRCHDRCTSGVRRQLTMGHAKQSCRLRALPSFGSYHSSSPL
jgi:hypothetical protein